MAALTILFISCVATLPDTETVKKTSSVGIGEEGRLHQEGYNNVLVCKTKAYLDEFTDAVVAKDEIGYKSMFDGKCYSTSSLDNYGRVLVLDRTMGTSKFRFIEPEATHYKETAWTFREYIIPIDDIE